MPAVYISFETNIMLKIKAVFFVFNVNVILFPKETSDKRISCQNI